MPWLVIIALQTVPMDEQMRDYFAGEELECRGAKHFGVPRSQFRATQFWRHFDKTK